MFIPNVRKNAFIITAQINKSFNCFIDCVYIERVNGWVDFMKCQTPHQSHSISTALDWIQLCQTYKMWQSYEMFWKITF